MGKENKHTPGPWFQAHWKDSEGMYSTEVFCSQGHTIATLSWYRMPPAPVVYKGKKMISTGTYRDGNAKLIASAPELLKLATWALEYIDAIPKETVLPPMPGFDRDWANSVIDKASA